jgi:hypothetical protein
MKCLSLVLCNTNTQIARTQKTMNITVQRVGLNLKLRRDLVYIETTTTRHSDVHTQIYYRFQARGLYTDFITFFPIIILTTI